MYVCSTKMHLISFFPQYAENAECEYTENARNAENAENAECEYTASYFLSIPSKFIK